MLTDPGSAVPVSLMDSVDYILEPAPSWLSLLAKPLSVVRVLVHALPFLVYARAEATWPVVLRFFQDLRTSPLPFDTSDLRIGAAGFCWGGRHVMALARDDPDTCAVRYGETVPRALVDCVFTAHPSNLHVPDDAENVRVPTSVVVGDIDAILRSGPARVMKSVLDKKDGHEMVILPGARHGFATRAGRGDGHARECAQRAEDQAVAWFLRAFNAGGA